MKSRDIETTRNITISIEEDIPDKVFNRLVDWVNKWEVYKVQNTIYAEITKLIKRN